MFEATSTKKKRNIAYYINSAIVVALMVGVGMLPPFAQITPLGMQILGIFIGVLYGWCTVSLIWPGLLGIIAIGATEYCTVSESFSQAFGDDITITIAVVYILAAYLEECGLNQYMANWFISRKIGEGRPWVFTLLIFAAAYVMSAFVSLYATVIILWMIFYKICDQIGEPPHTKYVAMVISGIVITCGLTGALFPFKAFPVIQIGLTEQAIGTSLDVNFFTWVLYNLVLSVGILALFLIMCKVIMRPDLSRLVDAGAKYAYLREQKMNREQKVGALVLVAFILGLALPSIFPESIPGITLLSEMGIPGIGILCMVVLAFVKKEDGKPYIDLPHLIAKGVNWELIILIAATMPLCNALEADEVGILSSVIAWLTQTFSGLSGTMFMVAITALFLIVTQFTHNLVLMLVFTPVLTKMGLNFGIDPMLIMFLIYYTAMTAYATPAASSQAALIFGNEKWVARKDAYLTGILVLICAFIVLLGIGIPLGNVMF